jgi:hypothetical protein
MPLALGKDPVMTIAPKRTMITAALAAGVLAAAGTASLGVAPPAPTDRPATQGVSTSAPLLAAVVTPNSLFGAGGAPQVLVLAPGGSLGLGGGAAPVSGGVTPGSLIGAFTPSGSGGAAAGPNFFAPTVFAGTAATPTGGGATLGAPMTFSAATPVDALDGLIGAAGGNGGTKNGSNGSPGAPG